MIVGSLLNARRRSSGLVDNNASQCHTSYEPLFKNKYKNGHINLMVKKKKLYSLIILLRPRELLKKNQETLLSSTGKQSREEKRNQSKEEDFIFLPFFVALLTFMGCFVLDLVTHGSA